MTKKGNYPGWRTRSLFGGVRVGQRIEGAVGSLPQRGDGARRAGVS